MHVYDTIYIMFHIKLSANYPCVSCAAYTPSPGTSITYKYAVDRLAVDI